MAALRATVTITAKYGPALQATSKVISNVKSYYVDVEKQSIAFHIDNGDQTAAQQEFDLTGVTTFTITISSGNQAITIS